MTTTLAGHTNEGDDVMVSNKALRVRCDRTSSRICVAKPTTFIFRKRVRLWVGDGLGWRELVGEPRWEEAGV